MDKINLMTKDNKNTDDLSELADYDFFSEEEDDGIDDEDFDRDEAIKGLLETIIAPLKRSERPRDLSDLMPSMRETVNVMNRTFNYTNSPKSIIITGSSLTGKTFVVKQLNDHLASLPSVIEDRTIFTMSKALKKILDPSVKLTDEDMSAAHVACIALDDFLKPSKDSRRIVYIDELSDALAFRDRFPSALTIIELSPKDAKIFQAHNKSSISNIYVIDLDDSPVKWGDLTNEIIRVDKALFDAQYPSYFFEKQIMSILKTCIKELGDEPYRKSDIVDIPVGVFVDIMESLHAKMLECSKDEISYVSTADGDRKMTVDDKTVRRLVKETMVEHPPFFDEDAVTPNVIQLSTNGLSLVDDVFSATISSPALVDEDGDPVEVPQGKKRKKTEKLAYSDVHTLADRMKAQIIDQDEAISTIVDAIKIDAARLHDDAKPVAGFLFTGPSGVGKTEVAKTLANELYEKPTPILRLDMSEYTDEYSMTKLFGSAPGLLGSDEGGQLTNFVLEHPQSVILLDEAEKAHPKVWNVFLQVFDAGRMTDGRGITVDFSGCVIIMTSNLGNSEQLKTKAGFGADDPLSTVKERSAITKKAYEKYFLPEFIGRLDAIITFNVLNREDIKKIIGLQIHKLAETVRKNHPKYDFDENLPEDLLEWLLKRSDSDRYGARQVQKTIKHDVMLRLADYLIDHDGDSAPSPSQTASGKRKKRMQQHQSEVVRDDILTLALNDEKDGVIITDKRIDHDKSND